MIIYSAHDDDLSLFENFLKLSLNIDLQYPHYASQLSIILVHNTDNKKYFVKIKFDDVILWNDTFDNFTQYVKKNLVSSIKVEELCGFPTPREKFKKSNSMTIVLITLLSVFSLILILSSIIIYKLCTHKFDVEGGLEEFN